MNSSALQSPTLDSVVANAFSIYISRNHREDAWDQFIRENDAGNHVQTSRWAAVKTVQNWESMHIILKKRERIIGGAQMLFRALPLKLAGSIAYIPKGPVFIEFSAVQFEMFICELKAQLKKLRIRHLILQPPRCERDYTTQLLDAGFHASAMSFSPTATVLIDLQQDYDEILARMKPKTRYNLRKAERQKITVREGDVEDLKTFHKLLVSTAQRQGFPAESQTFFLKLWENFKPDEEIKLFITQYENQDLSGILLITFGETIIYKRGGWFATQKNLKPNEYMHWHAIQWAKSQGFRYYDFEGITPLAAKLALAGKPLPDYLQNSIHRFKLGFGGDIVANPGPFEYIPNRVIRFFYYAVLIRVLNTVPLKKILNIFRIR